eukprot:166590_1
MNLNLLSARPRDPASLHPVSSDDHFATPIYYEPWTHTTSKKSLQRENVLSKHQNKDGSSSSVKNISRRKRKKKTTEIQSARGPDTYSREYLNDKIASLRKERQYLDQQWDTENRHVVHSDDVVNIESDTDMHDTDALQTSVDTHSSQDLLNKKIRELYTMKTRHEKNLRLIESAYYKKLDNVASEQGMIRGNETLKDLEDKNMASDIEKIILAHRISKPRPKPEEPPPRKFVRRPRTPPIKRMLARQAARPKSTISKKWFTDYMSELKDDQDKHLSYAFKAGEVPTSTMRPRFREMMRKREVRRLRIKQHSKELTLENQRPFSFTERDKKKALSRSKKDVEEEEALNFKFKASPVPEHVTQHIYNAMVKVSEEERKERIAASAHASLLKASLPPRMERWSSQTKTPIIYEEKRKPFKSKSVPDFDKLHKAFEQSLHNVKKTKEPVKTEEFNLSDRRESTKKKSKDVEPERNMKSFAVHEYVPVENPPQHKSTLKTDLRDSTIKASIQKRDERIRMKREQEECIGRVSKTLKRKIRSLTTDNRRSLRSKRLQDTLESAESMKAASKEYSLRIKHMRQRIEERPLLMEIGRQSLERARARRKALLTLKHTLDESGVRDYKKYFDEDELRDLDIQ